MAWTIEFTHKAKKDLARLDPSDARRIRAYLRERVASNPKAHGSQLKGPLKDFWRWRVGKYRVLARLENELLTVLVVKVEHRSTVYK